MTNPPLRPGAPGATATATATVTPATITTTATVCDAVEVTVTPIEHPTIVVPRSAVTRIEDDDG